MLKVERNLQIIQVQQVWQLPCHAALIPYHDERVPVVVDGIHGGYDLSQHGSHRG